MTNKVHGVRMFLQEPVEASLKNTQHGMRNILAHLGGDFFDMCWALYQCR